MLGSSSWRSEFVKWDVFYRPPFICTFRRQNTQITHHGEFLGCILLAMFKCISPPVHEHFLPLSWSMFWTLVMCVLLQKCWAKYLLGVEGRGTDLPSCSLADANISFCIELCFWKGSWRWIAEAVPNCWKWKQKNKCQNPLGSLRDEWKHGSCLVWEVQAWITRWEVKQRWGNITEPVCDLLKLLWCGREGLCTRGCPYKGLSRRDHLLGVLWY